MSLEKSSKFLRFFSSGEYKAVGMPTYQFKSFVLNVSERQLSSAGEPVPLTPKVFDTLVYLVEQAGHLAEKEKIMAAVWPDTIVEEGNLARSIHTLRKIFSQADGEDVFIETVPTKGYRFVAEVELLASEKADDYVPTKHHNKEIDVGPNRPPRSGSRPVLIAVGTLICAAGLMGLWLGDTESSARAAGRTTNGEAYRLYQQGRMLSERGLKGDMEEALRLFEKAIELSPGFAAAYAEKANARSQMFLGSNGHDDIIQARDAAKKAVELDPRSSLGLAVLCRIQGTYEWDFEGAIETCERAVQLDPSDPEALKELGFALNVVGREVDALAAMDRVVDIAPSSRNKRSRGLILYYSRRYEEAIEQFKQVEETDPAYQETAKWLIRAYAMKSDFSAALDRYLQWKVRSNASAEEINAIKAAFEGSGWPGVLRLMTDSPGTENPASNNIVNACNFAQLGERDKAFEVLDKMFERHAIMLATIGREPALEPLRGDPRFDHLMGKLKLK